jgi:hypothetical protein
MANNIVPTFGLQFIRVDDQAIPVIAANLDVVGLIGPCSTADPVKFPLDTPVFRFSNDITLANDLGLDGYILDAINGLNDQLADFQTAAQIVIVRTAYGTASDFNIKLQQTIAKIMGNSGAGTGIWAFKKAPNTLFCTPRLIMAPGYTGQTANSLDVLGITTRGVGYIPGQRYQVTFAQGNQEVNGATLVLPTAHAIADSTGSIDTAQMFIDSFGAWMTVNPIATLPAPDGTPPPAQAATGEMLFAAVPGVGASITLGGTVSTFVSGSPVGPEIQIVTDDLPATLTNLVNYLNASSDSQISLCTYNVVGTDAVTITYKAADSAGNGFTLASNVTGMTLSGPHLTGGADAQSATTAVVSAIIALGANPVCASLGGVLDNLIGHAVVESAGSSMISDQNWRTTLNHPRLIGVSGGCKVLDDNGDVIVMPRAGREIGLIIAKDFETGFPFHCSANRPIQGIVGPARTIDFSLLDGSTEGQVLLSDNIGIVARGLVGVETAISSGGFISISTDNLGDDPLWQFWNVMRGRDFIHLSLMPTLRTYLGRNNIDRQTVINVLTSIQNFLNYLTAAQQILGGRITFQGSLNTADEIRLGHITVGFAAEEPPVLRRITTMSARYKPAIDALVASLEQALSQIAT